MKRLLVWAISAAMALPAAAATASPPPARGTLSIGTLVQMWFRHNLLDQAEFLPRRAEIALRYEEKAVRLGFMMDPVSVPSSLIQDLYLEYGLTDIARFRIGQFIVPVTREGRAPSSRLDFIERARLAQSSAFGNRRDLGAMLDLRLFDRQSVQIGVFSGTGRNLPDVNRGKDVAVAVPATAWMPPNWPLRLGVGGSAYAGQDNAGTWFTHGAAEAFLTIESWYLSLEWVRGSLPTATGAKSAEQEGWSVSLVEVSQDSTRLGLRVEQFDPDLTAAGDEVREALVGISWDITEAATFQVNLIRYGVGGVNWQLDANRFLANFQLRL